MSDKTKKYWWLPWAVVVAVVMAVGVLFLPFKNWDFLLAPWLPSRVVVTKVAINEFSAGISDMSPYWDLRIKALLSILLTFIIGPSLWLYAEIKNQSKSSEDILKKGVIWYVGVFLVVVSLQVVPATFIEASVFQSTWDGAEKSEVADELRNGLSTLAFEALEKFHLSGGEEGADSFKKIATGGDIGAVKLFDPEGYQGDWRHTFMLAPIKSDSVITIHGVADISGPDADFENIDGETGKMEIAVEVRPPANFEFIKLNAK